MTLHNARRRAFLRQTAALGLLGTASPFALNLAGLGAATAATPSDYKALVCLFMTGGNDHYNTVVPFDTASYQNYYNARSTIARAQADLLEIVPNTAQGGRQFGVPKELAAFKTLFDAGHLATIANVGTLVAPVANVTQYRAAGTALPAKLFSHNDQQSTWQAFAPEGANRGWGGRFGDLLLGMNGNTVFTGISAAGDAVFLSGQNVRQFQVGTGGPVRISAASASSVFGSAQGATALRSVLTQADSSLIGAAQSGLVQRSIDYSAMLETALATLPESDARVALDTSIASDNLAQQLRIVARLAGVASALNVRRQVFFVNIGGFDTHDNQLVIQPKQHTRIANAVNYFYNATVKLGIDQQVTLFTASDFGRTLTSNGDGSDHGWGSHHFVVGGAVKGGNIYGTMPDAILGTTLDVGSGRLIPQIAVDQYAATLGRWFGVAESDLPLALPNIGRFASTNLGFML